MSRNGQNTLNILQHMLKVCLNILCDILLLKPLINSSFSDHIRSIFIGWYERNRCIFSFFHFFFIPYFCKYVQTHTFFYLIVLKVFCFVLEERFIGNNVFIRDFWENLLIVFVLTVLILLRFISYYLCGICVNRDIKMTRCNFRTIFKSYF